MTAPLAVTVTGDGPPLLWVHGYTMSAPVFRVLWHLLPGRRHVAVDLPGHGRSPSMPRDLTLPHLAVDLAAVAREHGCRDVVGLSFGSMAVVQTLVDHPDVFDRAVLAAPTLAGAAEDPAAEQCFRELAVLKRHLGVGPLLVERWMSSPPDIFRGTLDHPQLRAVLAAIIARHRWAELDTGAMRSLTAHVHGDEDLRRIVADVHVLSGTDDMPVFRANAARLGAAVDRCTVHDMPGLGHLPLLERPDLAAPLVDAAFAAPTRAAGEGRRLSRTGG